MYINNGYHRGWTTSGPMAPSVRRVGHLSTLALIIFLGCGSKMLPAVKASNAPTNSPAVLVQAPPPAEPMTSFPTSPSASSEPSSHPTTNAMSPNAATTTSPSAPFGTSSTIPSAHLSVPTGTTISYPSPLPTTPPPSKPPTCNIYDRFGVEMIYRDDLYKKNWDSSSWYDQISRNVSSPVITTDPYDSRVEVRGTGTVTFQDGEAKLYQSPYLYIEESGSSDRSGWADVEFTGYAKFSLLSSPKANTGINMQVRSDHGLVSTGNGCDAQFYWAQINYETGEASFMKELYHDEATVARSSKIIIGDIEEFSSGLPADEWVGVKFIAFTTGGLNVRLELWLDTSGGNNEWRRVASHEDSYGSWNTTKPVPLKCNQNEGDTILGPSRYCALFNVGRDESTQGKCCRYMCFTPNLALILHICVHCTIF